MMCFKKKLFVFLITVFSFFSYNYLGFSEMIPVTRSDDALIVCMPDDCTLRAAIRKANSNIDLENTITFEPDLGEITVTIEGEDDTNNVGDLDIIKNLTIQGNGPGITVITKSIKVERVFHVPENLLETVRLNIRDLTLKAEGEVAVDKGGAIYFTGLLGSMLSISNSHIYGFTAKEGGAIRVEGSLGVDTTTLQIDHSAINNNTSLENNGGGISLYNANGFMINSTISGNTSEKDGAGFYASTEEATTSFVILSSTIAENKALGKGGGIAIQSKDEPINLSIGNTIIIGNQADLGAPNCKDYDGNAPEEEANLISLKHNLLGDISECDFLSDATDQLNVDPQQTPVLQPLSDIGGRTPTHALSYQSPAIDMANPEGCLDIQGIALEFDQRGPGFSRVIGDECDIGAFESHASDIEVTKEADQQEVEVGDNLTYTLTVVNNGPNDNPSVQVTDALPAEVEFVSSNPGEPTCVHDENTNIVSCDLGALANGESKVIEITVKVIAVPDGGELINEVTVTSGGDDPNPDNSNDEETTTVTSTPANGNNNQPPQGTSSPNINEDGGYIMEGSGGCHLVSAHFAWFHMGFFLLGMALLGWRRAKL